MIEKIRALKEERNAVILAHNYQNPEVQDIADFTGDSLELSIKAADIRKDVIVFCGVLFMAETAKILSPDKIVLLPAEHAGCPMADMIDAKDLIALKRKHPGALAVSYVNSTAEVKAECDICVTSGNARRIVEGLPADREIIFVPDQNLGAHIEKVSGRKMILHPGYCPTHARITPEDIRRRRREYPDAPVLVHPECMPDVVAEGDEALSTGGMCAFVRDSLAKRFIIVTELGIIHRLKKENPAAEYIPVTSTIICPNMKLTTLEDVLHSLETLSPEVTVPEDIRRRAEIPIRRMLAGGIGPA
jgi:quinolinate synthase